ncbi:hypothetical protein [Glycomyces rhizosphaerae]|uniref:Uncharacterized protein n=1 Tax=Glycomyces rhizosphaerae TaxID=2054422 RepID=A0ABV7PXN1_9ACTN
MSASYVLEASDRQEPRGPFPKGRRKVGAVTWLHALWKATLIVVAVGVALMHSTGHACAENVCHPEVSAVAAAIDPHASSTGHEHEGQHDHPFGSDMNVMQVCMAILSGLALAVSLWALGRLARLVADSHWAMRIGRTAWDVPVSLPSGGRLSFIELSVFRI